MHEIHSNDYPYVLTKLYPEIERRIERMLDDKSVRPIMNIY